MASTGLSILRHARTMLGDGAGIDTDTTGVPRVSPHSEEGCSLILRAAADEGWRVRLEGQGRWAPAVALADLALSTRNLTRISNFNPGDLVVTVQAGASFEELRNTLAQAGMWFPVDPPGGGSRSVGSVVATGSAGPLRTGYGGVRDHLLGLTLVTGEGRTVKVGGRVVKNVAGFDLTKLASGSFGAFGLVTSVHLRLRAVPRADLTLLAHGERDELARAGKAILKAGLVPAALELLSPGVTSTNAWTLAIRLLGHGAAVEAERKAIAGAAALALSEMTAEQAAEFWDRAQNHSAHGSTTLRIGTLLSELDAALDLVVHYLDQGWLSAGLGGGVVRWSGDADARRIKLLRNSCAEHEMPVTVERAPWEILTEVGHFGALREGVGRLVTALQASFDPAGVIVAPAGDS